MRGGVARVARCAPVCLAVGEPVWAEPVQLRPNGGVVMKRAHTHIDYRVASADGPVGDLPVAAGPSFADKAVGSGGYIRMTSFLN